MTSSVAAVYDRRQPQLGGPDNLLSGWPKATGGNRNILAKTINHIRATAFLPTLLALTACTSSATSEKMAQIKPAMKVEQVEALLGRPAHIDQAETTSLRGETYHYPASNGEGRVVFLNDTVFKAEFIPGGKQP
jgi:hypothetical protein